MFGFLKKKLSNAISRFSEKAEEAVQVAGKKIEEKTAEELVEEAKTEVEKKEKPEDKQEPQAEEKHKEKRGIFGRIKKTVTGKATTTKISEKKFVEMFWEFEVTLLENNVAVGVIDKIKTDLKEALVEKPLQRGKIAEAVKDALRNSIETILITEADFIGKVRSTEKPCKVMLVGINGSGKTTTIAKLTKMLKDSGMNVVIAAADTFRAAAIQQMQEHADKLGVKMVKHDYGADPAAVAFDAIRYAEAHNIDVVLIDTAGRLHSNTNLMDEMKKIGRVVKPHIKIFVGESTTGNDCIEQARKFNEAICIDGIILAKADVDEKGGAAISVSYITSKPIFFIGTGQEYDDLKPFNHAGVLEGLGLA